MLLVTPLPSNRFHINNSWYLVPTLRYPIPCGTAKRIACSASKQGVAAWCPKNMDLLHSPISPEPNHQFPWKLDHPFPLISLFQMHLTDPQHFCVHFLYIIYPRAIQQMSIFLPPCSGRAYPVNDGRSGHWVHCWKFEWWCSQSFLCFLLFGWETHAHLFTPFSGSQYSMKDGRSGHFAPCRKF